MSVSIRQFQSDDWNAVREIYEQGLLTRNATFETEVPDYDSWIKKFHSHSFKNDALVKDYIQTVNEWKAVIT